MADRKRNSSVAESNAAHAEMVKCTRPLRDLLGGTAVMRDKQRTYLPQNKFESNDAYQIRRDKTFLDNTLETTVEDLGNAPFARDVTISEAVPGLLHEWLLEPSRDGRSLTDFAQDVFKDALVPGIGHFLVDYPSSGDFSTRAEELQAGVRSYLAYYPMEDVFRWHWRSIDGRPVLTRVHLREMTTEEDPEDPPFGEREVSRVRVLYRGDESAEEGSEEAFARFELWEERQNEWTVVKDGFLQPHVEIPFVTFNLSQTGFMAAKPPLGGLAWKLLEHWQSSSMQRHVLDFARFAILFGKELGKTEDGETVVVGPNHLVEGGPNSDLKYVEHQGHAIEAGFRDLERLEDAMRKLSREPKVPKAGAPTATGERISELRSSRSHLGWVRIFEGALQEAIGLMADWAGIEDFDHAGSVTISRDFTLELMDALHFDALEKARVRGDIDQETYLQSLKRRKVLGEDDDIGAIIEASRSELAGVGSEI